MSSSHGCGNHNIHQTAFASANQGNVLQNNVDSASYSNNDCCSGNNIAVHSTPTTTSGPGPCLIDANGKRFRTAYGTVMWPTLPGLTGQTLTAPAAGLPSAEMMTLSPAIGSSPGAAGAEKGEGGTLTGSMKPIARSISSDAWSVNLHVPASKGKARGGTGGAAKQKCAAKLNVCVPTM